jgi:hypothetical protein
MSIYICTVFLKNVFNHLECIKWISALVNCVVYHRILHGKRIFFIDHVLGGKEFEADSRTF